MLLDITTTIGKNIGYFSLDHLLVYLFLLVTLVVGWYVGRKNKTIDDYALGGRAFSTSVLVMTFLATQLGGATTIGLSSRIFSDGIIMLVASSGYFVCRLFIALFMAPKMVHFEGCLTIGDMMGQLYGERSRLATAIIGTLSAIFVVAAQSLALGIIFEALLGMKRNVGIVIGGLTVVAYAAFGGIKSVAFTDVIQFIVLIIMIPLIAVVATNHQGGVSALFHKVPAEKWVVFGHEKFTDYLLFFLIGGVFPSEAASPPVVQRMLMARDKKQVAGMLNISIITTFGFEFMVMLIGFAALVSYPEISANNALPQIVNKLLPLGLKGFAVVGLLAVVMSTADSCLNVAGLLISHDIIKPLCDKRRVAVDELKLVKYVTLIIGVAGILLAAFSIDVLQLAFYGWGILGLTLTIPFIAGVLGLKPDARSFFFSLGVTLLTFIGLLLAKPAQQNLAIGWGIVANAISFLGAHVLQNGGFKWVEREQYEQPVWRIHWKNVGKNFCKVLPIPQNIVRYSQQKVAKHGSLPSVLAIFCCLTYVIPYLLWLPEQKGYITDFLVIRLVGGSLCVFLLTKDYWPTWLKPYFPVCWHLSLLYCLPLVATLAYLLMGGNTAVWFTNITLSMLVLAWLVDWLSFALLSVIGMVLGIALYLGMVYGFSIEMQHLKEATAIYLIMYVCITIAFIASTLARRKEEAIEEEKQLIKLYAADIAHDLDNTIGSVRLFASGIASFLKYAPIQEQTDGKGNKGYFLPDSVYEFIKDLPNALQKESDKGYQVIKVMLEAVKRGSLIDPTQLAEHSLQACVANTIQGYHMEEDQRQNITFQKANDFTVFADPNALWHVFYNILKNAHRYAGHDCQLTLWLDATHRCLHIKDNGPGIPPDKLSKIFEPFYTGSRVGSGIGLGLCKTIMEGLGGRIYCKSQQGEGAYAEFVMTFPTVQAARSSLTAKQSVRGASKHAQ